MCACATAADVATLTGTLILGDARRAVVEEGCVSGALAARHALLGAHREPVVARAVTRRAARAVHLGVGAAAVGGCVTRHVERCRCKTRKNPCSRFKHMKLRSNITTEAVYCVVITE